MKGSLTLIVASLVANLHVFFFSSASGTAYPQKPSSDSFCRTLDSSSCPEAGRVGADSSCAATDSRRSRVLELILAEDYQAIDEEAYGDSIGKKTDVCISALKQRGAHRCWHKHSTFLEHLLGVHNILTLWGESRIIAHVGLFHSAYSNSYVNLALFDPSSERDLMKELIGPEAEGFVHMFCVINRQEVVVNTLLRQGFIPREGITVPHLRNKNETVFLSAETLRMLVIFTMADIADQYFGWQDQLFGGGGEDGSMIIPGKDFPDRHNAQAIWPGMSTPGLWMSYVSQLAKVARTYDPAWLETNQRNHQVLRSPPVFSDCTQTLSIDDEVAARDLYWSVAMGDVADARDAIATLKMCSKLNPWAFEPQVLLAQKLLHVGDLEAAIQAAERALDLQQQWGTAWDKRLGFGAWVAWTRVLHQRASDGVSWPTNSWDVNNLGLVR